jgi:hypothetical protein
VPHHYKSLPELQQQQLPLVLFVVPFLGPLIPVTLLPVPVAILILLPVSYAPLILLFLSSWLLPLLVFFLFLLEFFSITNIKHMKNILSIMNYFSWLQIVLIEIQYITLKMVFRPLYIFQVYQYFTIYMWNFLLKF